MSKHTVLYVRRYDFSDSDGKRVSGVKVSYLDDQPDESKDARGMPILCINAPVTAWEHFRVVPGFYDLDFRQRPDSKGKPALTLRSATFVGPVQAAQAVS